MVGIQDDQGRLLTDTGPLYENLSRELSHERYSAFAGRLGFPYPTAMAILDEVNKNYSKAFMKILNSWESASDSVASKTDLLNALRGAKVGSLCTIVEEHFREANGDTGGDGARRHKLNEGMTASRSEGKGEFRRRPIHQQEPKPGPDGRGDESHVPPKRENDMWQKLLAFILFLIFLVLVFLYFK